MSNSHYIPRPIFDTLKNVVTLHESVYASGDQRDIIREWLSYCFKDSKATFPACAVKDYQMALSFLYSYRGSTSTFRAYRRDIERLLQWAWFVCGNSALKLRRKDLDSFMAFCQKPYKRWVALKSASRFKKVGNLRVPNSEWRPFESKKGVQYSENAVFPALRDFFAYLMREEVIQADPTAFARQKGKRSSREAGMPSSPIVRQLRHAGNDEGLLKENAALKRKLSQAEFKVGALLADMSEGTYLLLPSENHKIDCISRHWQEWTGYSPEEIYKNPEKWILPININDRKVVVEAYKAALYEEKPYSIEYTLKHRKTGKATLVRDKGKPIQGGGAHTEFVRCIVTDMSGEQVLRQRNYDLNERVKELRLFYNVSTVLKEYFHTPLQSIMQKIVELIPLAFQFPDMACARITGDDFVVATENFKKTKWKLASSYSIDGDASSVHIKIEVFYLSKPKHGKKAPFLKEEFALIDVLTMNLANLVDRRTAEQKLQDREKLFRVLYEATNDAIMTLEPPSWDFTSGNLATQKLFNVRDEEEFVALHPAKLSPKYQPDGQLSSVKAKKMIMLAMKKGMNFFEWTHKKATGEDFFATVLLSRVQLKGKTFLQARVNDITARKKREEENARLSAIVQQACEGMAVIDLGGSLIFANLTWCKMHGYRSQKEVLGENISIFCEDSCTGGRLSSVGRLKTNVLYQGEVVHRTKGGKTFPTLVTSTIIKDEKGKPYAVAVIALDITKRKQDERVLSESEKRFRVLFESVRDAIFICNAKSFQVVYVNQVARKLTGYKAYELLKMNAQKFFPENVASVFKSYVDECKKGKDCVTHDVPILKKNQKIVFCDVSFFPLVLDGESCLALFFRDMTAHHQYEKMLKEKNRALMAIRGVNQLIVHAKQEQELLESICNILIEIAKYDAVWIGFIEDGREKLIHPVAWRNIDAAWLGKMRTKFTWEKKYCGHGPIGDSIRSGRTAYSEKIVADEACGSCKDFYRERGFRTLISLPLVMRGKVFGVINIYSKKSITLGREEQGLLEEMAGDVAYGIRALRSEKVQREAKDAEISALSQLRNSLESTITVIALTVEKRDPYTAGHQRRVAQLAKEIALELKLPRQQVEGIFFAGLIHDIGKIHLPAEILTRPGKLEEDEFRLIKKHPQAGYDIVENVEFPWPIAEMMLSHHERLDGSGYPRGLKAKDIGIGARILAVSDVFEAMCSRRPYRAALGVGAALKEIKKHKGKLYDAKVVNVCARLFEEKNFVFFEIFE